MVRKAPGRPVLNYVAHYAELGSDSDRVAAASAVAKVDYVVEALVAAGYRVRIISPARSVSHGGAAGAVIQVSDFVELVLFRSLPWRGKLSRVASLLYGDVALFTQLLRNGRRDSPVIVYHSLDHRLAVTAARLIRRFKLVLEVEEVYSDASPRMSALRRLVEASQIRAADAYILSTALLRDRLRIHSKPSVVCHGPYSVMTVSRPSKFSEADGRVHVVYAGVVDRVKQGAFRAALTALHLSSHYHVHILGFGAEDDVAELLEEIGEVCGRGGQITYDGFLNGGSYAEFLQRCDIGLATQTNVGSYNDSSFPSKVLSYLQNGLSVVSTRARAVEESQLASVVHFSASDAPEDVARAVQEASRRSKVEGIALLHELHEEFVTAIGVLLGGCDPR